ncbi:MAG: M16 family metallopeptidase [bacterium]
MERIKRILIAVALLIAAPACLHAEVKEYELENGLKVLVIEDHKVPLATFQIWYKVGSRNEPAFKTGISHLLEHMMFKGTPKYGSKVFSRLVQKNGGMDNAFTTYDYTVYFQTLASDRIDLSIELEADRMENLTLDPKEVLSERDVVLEERRMRYEDDPQNALFEDLMAASFETHPYHHPVIGWESDLRSITRDDLFSYYKSYYAPDNAFIVIAGDVKADEVVKKIRDRFGKIPRGKNRIDVTSVEPEQRGERRVYLEKEARLPYVIAAYHTPNFPDEDSYALDVLSAVLSGKSGRLYQSLVYQKKIALETYADYNNFMKDPMLFFLGGTAAPGNDISVVERALYEEIDGLKEKPPAPEEIQKAKNQVEASFIMGQDSLFAQARMIGMFEFLGGWRMKDVYLDGIRKVTPEDVQRVAGKYFSRSNRTVGILIPKEIK